MYICIATTQTTSTETQASALEPIDTETTADNPLTSVQIETNIGEYGGVGTEERSSTEFIAVETMDVVDEILTSSPSSSMLIEIDECASGIDTEKKSTN